MDNVVIKTLRGETLTVPRNRVRWLQRSAIVQREKCPQKAFYAYHWGPEGRGVQSGLTPDHFELGSAVHYGVERLMLGHPISEAAENAAQYFRDHSGSLMMSADPDLQQVNPEAYAEMVEEQAHLAYGLVWAFNRRVWPALQTAYEVVALEQEIQWLVGIIDGIHYVMMTRVDGVLRGRADGRLYVVSHKTTKKMWPDTIDKLSLDIQAVTEGSAIICGYDGVVPAGTLYFYFIKGERKTDEFGYKRYESPLVRPFIDAVASGGAAATPTAFAIAGRWPKTPDEPGGALGRHWKRGNIWEHADYVQYLEWLDAGYIQPARGRDWMGELVAQPIVEVWDQGRADRVLAQILREESAWTDEVNHPDRVARRTHMCHEFNSRCSFYGICHQGDSIEAGLITGRWQPRVSNHAAEDGVIEGD